MSTNPVDKYIASSADFAKPILEHLRELVHTACPEVQEKIKWGFPNFDYHGIMCNMASFKNHCSFGFWKAALLDDPENVLSANGKSAMGHFGKLTTLKDLPADKIVIRYIKQAMKLNEEGITVMRKPKEPQKKLVVPPYFKKALSKAKVADKMFLDFSYSKKKDYLEWFAEAKTEQTRDKRIETALEWIAEGKGRNWKYERKG